MIQWDGGTHEVTRVTACSATLDNGDTISPWASVDFVWESPEPVKSKRERITE